MYFNMKSDLKNTHNHTIKHAHLLSVSVSPCNVVWTLSLHFSAPPSSSLSHQQTLLPLFIYFLPTSFSCIYLCSCTVSLSTHTQTETIAINIDIILVVIF